MPAMASPTCWKCLCRPSVTSSLPVRAIGVVPSLVQHPSPAVCATAPFSTSSSLAAAVAGKSKLAESTKGQKKSVRVKKKDPNASKSGRPPAVGERKAWRKRIILSNGNALAVEGMQDMTKDMVLSKKNIGKVAGIPGTAVDQLRTIEAFKPSQGWGLFRRPGMLIRSETVEIAKAMSEAAKTRTTDVKLLDGAAASGKSALMLQSMSIAFLNNWVVLYLPDAKDLVDATTDYSPVESDPSQYFQGVYAAGWLSRIAKSNANVLSKLKVTMEHKVPLPVNKNTTLETLALMGAREPEFAQPMLNALWAELTAPSRPPIFFGLDGLAYIMQFSKYLSPDLKLIHAHDLSLVSLFVDYFSGAKKLPNGGVVMAATTKSNTPAVQELALALKNKEETKAKLPLTQQNPYLKYDDRAFKSLQAAKLMRVEGLSKAEARGLMEYWAASGILRRRVDELTVTEAWAVSGSGIVGEMERGTLSMRI